MRIEAKMKRFGAVEPLFLSSTFIVVFKRSQKRYVFVARGDEKQELETRSMIFLTRYEYHELDSDV